MRYKACLGAFITNKKYEAAHRQHEIAKRGPLNGKMWQDTSSTVWNILSILVAVRGGATKGTIVTFASEALLGICHREDVKYKPFP